MPPAPAGRAPALAALLVLVLWLGLGLLLRRPAASDPFTAGPDFLAGLSWLAAGAALALVLQPRPTAAAEREAPPARPRRRG